MYKSIDRKEFRGQVERLLSKSISTDYVCEILDMIVGYETVYEQIKKDVEETSAWEDEEHYNEDDIKLAIGRAFIDCLTNWS